jgi:uncharacterized protein YjiS (DUF1127 family)
MYAGFAVLRVAPVGRFRLTPMRAPRRITARLGAALVRAHDRLAAWQERSAARRSLLGFDAQALKDLGLGQCEAYREYSKPFWRP